MHILYNFSIHLMRFFVAFMSLFKRKMRLRHQGSKAVFTVLEENVDKSKRYVWFHAASLGEFEQGRPMIERLRRAHPEQKIILTFFSLRVTKFVKIMPTWILFVICRLTCLLM